MVAWLLRLKVLLPKCLHRLRGRLSTAPRTAPNVTSAWELRGAPYAREQQGNLHPIWLIPTVSLAQGRNPPSCSIGQEAGRSSPTDPLLRSAFFFKDLELSFSWRGFLVGDNRSRGVLCRAQRWETSGCRRKWPDYGTERRVSSSPRNQVVWIGISPDCSHVPVSHAK